MILVRDIFIAKPGMASKLAKEWKAMMPKSRVLTDMTGQYHTVVMETEYQDIAAWEEEMKKYMGDSQKDQGSEEKKSGPNYNEMYTEGRREIYKIW